MVASPRQRLILPLAPLGAGIVGVFTALLFLVLPSGPLESLVVDSGMAALFNAAQPPLGLTARAVLALASGGVSSVLAWIGLFVLVGSRSVIVNRSRADGGSMSALRRADAHPDAPPRQPVFANRDLGTPFLQVRAEPPVPVEIPVVAPVAVPMGPASDRAVPTDLDQSLATFDPASFAGPARSLPVEDFETTAPIPIRRDTSRTLDLIAAQMQSVPPPVPPQATESSASIRALLDRLERSVAQREATPAPARPESLRDTLETLRGLATRTG